MDILQIPGKPHAFNIKSDSISLMWERAPEKHESFQICYKPENEDSRWKFYENYVEENNVVINGLMADTGYRFQVRGLYKDQEESYGPISDVIKTRKSLATKILESCGPSIVKTTPSKYILPVQENKMSRNTVARTRQLTLGKSKAILNVFKMRVSRCTDFRFMTDINYQRRCKGAGTL